MSALLCRTRPELRVSDSGAGRLLWGAAVTTDVLNGPGVLWALKRVFIISRSSSVPIQEPVFIDCIVESGTHTTNMMV
jgi:hypothetical protein